MILLKQDPDSPIFLRFFDSVVAVTSYKGFLILVCTKAFLLDKTHPI